MKGSTNKTKINCHSGKYTLPNGLIRLHVSLSKMAAGEDDDLIKYAGIKRGNTITRDIIVHEKITLRSLHYLLQRAFGFTNSHLHHFSISDSDVIAVTDNNIGNLLNLRGIIFTYQNSKQEDYEPEFHGGSIKHWMSSMYKNHAYLGCGEELWDFYQDPDDSELLLDSEWYLTADDSLYVIKDLKDSSNQSEEIVPESLIDKVSGNRFYVKRIKDAGPRWLNSDQHKVYERCNIDDPNALLAVKVCFGDMTIRQGIISDIESVPQNIIERLPVSNVLSVSSDYLPYNSNGIPVHTTTKLKRPQIISSEEILSALKKQKTILPRPFTDTLYYTYDYGDNWNFIITGSRGCSDLVEDGTINEDTFNESVSKALNEWCPVLIARDGDMLIEDVGGIGGMIRFLKWVNIGTNQIIKQESDFVDPADLGYIASSLDEEDYLEHNKYTQEDYKRDAADDWLDKYMEKNNKKEDENGYTKAGLLSWALNQGWHRNDFENIDFL